jgi:CHAT domain-containing protein/Tfp pilus assembly protein PilF
MTQSTRSVIKPGGAVRRLLKRSLILSQCLLILSSPIRASYPYGNNFNGLSTGAQPVIEASRAAPQQPIDAAVLEPGKPIERELAGGEAHTFQLTLTAGQYTRVFVEQRRINIALSAFDPEGKKLVEADGFAIGETELVSLIARISGVYRFEVRSPDKTAPKGRYEIKINEVRVATEQDKNLATAEQLIAEGIMLVRQPTADSWVKAVDKYQQSIPFCQSAKEPAWEATALYLIGSVYTGLGEKQKAFDFANRALPIAKAAASQAGDEQRKLGLKVEANALDTIGYVHIEFGDKKKALELFNQALPLRQAAGDRVGEAGTLNNIGMAHNYMGEWPKAVEFFKQALQIVSELGDQRKTASLVNNLGTTYNDLGEYKKALAFFQQALAIRRGLGERSGVATVLNNMGNSYSNLGEYQKAFDLYNEALAIHKEISPPHNQAIALNNIGWFYATLGEYQKAIDFYNQSLKIFRDVGDQYREGNTLSNIAVNYADLKDFRRALEINQEALRLRRAVNNQEGEAITLNNIASCHMNLGDKQQALDYFNQSITLHRKVVNPRQLATALRNIGTLYRDLGDQQKALDNFNEGLQMTRAIGDRNNEAGILAHIARLERDRGNLFEAKERIEQALAAIESLRINVKSPQLRASFLASVRNYYEFDIDVLMRLHKQRPSEGFDAAALEACERGRARSLLDLLSEARAEIRQGVDPALLERERALRQIISDKAERQIRMLSGKHSEDQATAAAKELDALTTDYEQLQVQIRQKSPRYVALTQPVPLGSKELQKRVLDDETLLLEYALGQEKSFLWALTPTSIQSFELPKRAEIEQQSRHLYDLLTARNTSQPKETLEQRRQRLARADAEYLTTSATLSQMLLGPVAAELKNKRLLIVGEGILQYVPFAALPNPVAADSPPLIVSNEIVTLPSASVVAVLRQETGNRQSPDKLLAVLADPVFSNQDPRVPHASKNTEGAGEVASSMTVAKRSAEESGLGDLVRLRFSRQEAEEIARFANDKLKLQAVDFAANRALATSPELSQYRIVHFAAHGLINNAHPELSGVVLSLVDKQGQAQNGFLRLYDIYNLKLAADLVVLSACQTALGKEIKGEGIVGLTRGFMYAGARRVVASVWQVDDRATAELMRRFYQSMLGEGLPPVAALRAAQVAMWREKRWQSPYFWAAFTLQGEWK